jgi:5-methylcytosine-specific restriction endonuclease McrA
VISAEHQLLFLQKFQRLLDEGKTVSTYKFALLASIADIAIENGDVGNGRLTISSNQIAEKFIQLYWRQSLPFPSNGEILAANNGKQAAIINQIIDAQTTHGTLARLTMDAASWTNLAKSVARVITVMPLWKLQTVGSNTIDDFLYPNIGRGSHIELKEGVAYTLRRFHPQLTNMIHGSWIRWVRRHKHNQSILGETVDLGDFLFGSERSSLTHFVPLLQEIQKGSCFYCRSKIKGTGDVDHFIPWSQYPVDRGHNFVLTHAACNRSKSDMLASTDHLNKWVERNNDQEKILTDYFDRHQIHHDLDASSATAQWAYERAEQIGSYLWQEKRQLMVADSSWRLAFA